MRHVEGIVCVADFTYGSLKRIIYGQNKNLPNGQMYENIQTNGIVPYLHLEEAKEGAAQINLIPDVSTIAFGRLEMHIAETRDEILEFKGKKSLLVLMLDDWVTEFLGPTIKGKRDLHPLPCACFNENGFISFPNSELAEYVAREVNRQAQCAIQMAMVQLAFLEK